MVDLFVLFSAFLVIHKAKSMHLLLFSELIELNYSLRILKC